MPGGYPGAGLLSTYMMWYVLQCGEYAARAGDDGRAFADFAKARVLRNIEFLTKYENSDGLLENLPGWVFIEWSHAADLVKGINYPANMLWAKTLDCAAALYGRGDFAERAERLRETIRRRSGSSPREESTGAGEISGENFTVSIPLIVVWIRSRG